MNQGGEQIPTLPNSQPEPASAGLEKLPAPDGSSLETGPERAGVAINQLSQPVQAVPLSLPPVVLPPAAAPVAADDTNSPLIADDVDVIEKEWVDKAKRIVDENREDPHNQERAVEKLQRAYLKKRYNKDLKASDI